MKKKLQVFVSSTYTDMLAERQAAVEAILRAGHIPAGMELFAAGDQSQWDTIREWIDDSDVFMLILGGRYGSVEPNSGKSYIQLEYEYAVEKKKPHFAAVISEKYLDAKVRAGGSGLIETENGNLLRTLRETVTRKICRFFDDVKELKLIVFESLHTYEHNEALAGWVRGTDVLDPKATLEEIARMTAQITSLKSELAERDALAASDAAGGPPTSVTDVLSKDAKDLLVAAAESDGYILFLETFGGSTWQVGGTNLMESQESPREQARWKSALGELLGHGLVERAGSQGETFRVTKRGYDAADVLKSVL